MKNLLVAAEFFRAKGSIGIHDEINRSFSHFLKCLKTIDKIIFLILKSRLVFLLYLLSVNK